MRCKEGGERKKRNKKRYFSYSIEGKREKQRDSERETKLMTNRHKSRERERRGGQSVLNKMNVEEIDRDKERMR